MNVSVGVIAHNEEKNIGRLLDSIINQKLNSVKITEIIVVSSGSTDKTNELVTDFFNKHRKIRLIVENQRRGKFSAINQFLSNSRSDILVQISGDVWLEDNTIEEICKPLQNPWVGIVGGHPIPINSKNNIMGHIVHFQWDLHHELSLIKPKFGEIIAFRRVFRLLNKTAVDEEYIASCVCKSGLRLVYAQKAVIHNKGPDRFIDFISQRRRIYAGHLILSKQKQYSAASMDYLLILKALLNSLVNKKTNIVFIPLCFSAEGFARLLGLYDFYVKRNSHIVWKVAESAKFKK